MEWKKWHNAQFIWTIRFIPIDSFVLTSPSLLIIDIFKKNSRNTPLLHTSYIDICVDNARWCVRVRVWRLSVCNCSTIKWHWIESVCVYTSQNTVNTCTMYIDLFWIRLEILIDLCLNILFTIHHNTANILGGRRAGGWVIFPHRTTVTHWFWKKKMIPQNCWQR